jgi:hypothetical protein
VQDLTFWQKVNAMKALNPPGKDAAFFDPARERRIGHRLQQA